MMLSRKFIQLFLLLCLFSINIFAIDGKIRVFIKSKDTVYTSQKVTVSIELLSDAFSITDAKITFPPSNKYIVQAPQSAAYLDQDEIDGDDWQVAHYEYAVYALQAGKIEIPSVSVSFSASMGYGQPKKEFALKSDTLHFDVKAPAGIKNNQFVLVTDNYTLISERKPDKIQLIVGDAIELSITQKAHAVPDILLKPMDYKSNAMLRVYDKEPELKSGLKGKYDVSRTDRFTFVASGEGNVTIPSLETVWWNSKTKKVQVEKIPEMTFEILADPQIAIDAKKAQQKERLIYLAVTSFLLIMFYIIFASKVRGYVFERKRVYALSEEGRFKTLLERCHDSNATKVYHTFYDWLEVADPKLFRKGFRGICEVHPALCIPLSGLEEAVVDSTWSSDKLNFIKELKKFRELLLLRQKDSVQGLIKNINPE